MPFSEGMKTGFLLSLWWLAREVAVLLPAKLVGQGRSLVLTQIQNDSTCYSSSPADSGPCGPWGTVILARLLHTRIEIVPAVGPQIPLRSLGSSTLPTDSSEVHLTSLVPGQGFPMRRSRRARTWRASPKLCRMGTSSRLPWPLAPKCCTTSSPLGRSARWRCCQEKKSRWEISSSSARAVGAQGH